VQYRVKIERINSEKQKLELMNYITSTASQGQWLHVVFKNVFNCTKVQYQVLIKIDINIFVHTKFFIQVTHIQDPIK
jgi:hypothetical protein